ncbi:MAG TPA: molybdopterin cofactor-binding domain-containing protein [Candidatus Binatia bacterium]|nr:molybdopterin cofactor-binding domain-containing protein [Candidatus Binatia bacterium]
MTTQLNRRTFLGATASLTLAFPLVGSAPPAEAQAASAPLNIWVTIGTDNTVTIVSPAAEMGQGSFTSLPLILSEDLDADWSRVRIVQPASWDSVYGNPLYRMALLTSSSFSVRGYYLPLRIAGAQARRVLLDAVAARWQVPVAELSTEPNTVVHRNTDRRISYGAVAMFAVLPATLPAITEKDLKSSSQFRLIGKDVPRVEVPLKVRGAAKYAMDANVPGMLYAAVLQSPYPGGSPVTIDDRSARAARGIVDVVTLPDGVGVLGTSVEATRFAKNLLRVTWSDAPAGAYDSDAALDEFAAVARNPAVAGVAYEKQGDAGAALASAASVMRAEYRTHHIYHGQMEPLTATVSLSPDGSSAEVWAGTQAPSDLRTTIAALLKTKPDRITLHQQFVGGAYGRRGSHEVVIQATRLAAAAKKPVKLIWSREDDLRFGRFRPATAHHIEAGFDAGGKIVAWRHRVVSESVLNFMTDGQTGTKATDRIVMKGTQIPSYGIPNKLAEHVIQIRGARLSSYRGVGNGYNTFAVEGFLDEIARAKGQDPLALRRALAAGNPRAIELFRTVAAMADWERKRPGRALGFAFSEKDDTLNAGIAEISLDRPSGKITVHNVWMAIDAGIAVQPRNIAAQLEGGICFAVGHVLRERVDIKKGHVQQSNFYDYQVTRMADVPHIEIKVLSTNNPPMGVGEDGVPIVAASVGNAFFALTGVRLRELPFSPEQVLRALA